MNPSHSSTFNITDSLRTPPKTAGASSDRLSDERASDSFNTLYHSQSASFSDTGHNKPSNINDLNDDRDNSASTQAAEGADPTTVDEAILQDEMDEIPTLVEHNLASEDQISKAEPAHGISVALASNSSQKETGEKLPLSGKKLPPSVEAPNQDALNKDTLLTKPEEIPTKVDRGIEIQLRNGNSERIDQLKSTQLDLSVNDNRLEKTHTKTLFESLGENLSQQAPKNLQDSTTVLTANNNSSIGLTAAISQTDATNTQKLISIADIATNTDLNTSLRNGSLDRSHALGEKIYWMQNAKISTAELHLHPAELGSIEIKIITEDQQTRVSFITSSASARDVIEESLPKLRELLADSGLELDQSDISQKGSDSETANNSQQDPIENMHIEREVEREFTSSPISTRIGQVDHYV